ncbi:MAG: acetyl-CoA sensor PanZ family protein [Pseudomonadota bacterium]|nr:acetyl-CoA sensor PanZ family protein [Pseudomonadota bacterium]
MPVIVSEMRQTETHQKEIQKLYQDLPQAASLLSQVLPEVPEGCRYYVGVFNSKITAAALIKTLDNKTVELSHVAVHPANRGRDIAARVVGEVVAHETKLGTKQMHTPQANDSGTYNALAKSCGFKKVDSDDAILTLNLQK